MKMLVVISILTLLYTGILRIDLDEITYCEQYYISSEEHDIKIDFIGYDNMIKGRSLDNSAKMAINNNNHFKITIMNKGELSNTQKNRRLTDIWDIKKRIKLKNDKGTFPVDLFIPEPALGENIQTYLISFKKANMSKNIHDKLIFENMNVSGEHLEIELKNNCQ